MRSIALLALLIVHVTFTDGAAADETADTLKQLQGTWLAAKSLPGGGRIEKEIVDDSETTRVLDAKNNVVHAQQSTFQLERAGKLTLLHWTGAKVTEGPQRGQTVPDGTAVIRVEDQQWFSVFGLDAGSKFSVFTDHWLRPKSEPKPGLKSPAETPKREI